MKQKINYEEIEDGDIIYVINVLESGNEHLIGDNVVLTGEDQIFIIDDSGLAPNEPFLINGGHELYLDGNSEIYKIGHYSKLVNV